MSPDNFTVLEIGSGSFKLFREGHFNERYESSLGRGLSPDGALASDSISISLSNLKDNIIPFLKTQGIKLEDVLVFATAAIRRAVNDPNKSGQKFIKALEDLGFNGIRVFSETSFHLITKQFSSFFSYLIYIRDTFATTILT